MSGLDLAPLLGGMRLSQTSSKPLIIAIDFGTTYSGVAYCFPEQRDAKPRAVNLWPGMGTEKQTKIPTVIEYDQNDPTKFSWGPLVKESNDTLIGIKLLFDIYQKLPSYISRNTLKTMKESLPKAAPEIAADFIRALHAHAMSHIETKLIESSLESYSIDYVLSVPAVWSDAAKHATLEAAKKAGISPVTLIKEPEAAALYTIREQDFALKRGDVLLVCDAGGGTVDLVSYKVENTLPTLELKEIVPATAALVGSLALNIAFTDHLKSIIPKDRRNAFKASPALVYARKDFEDRVKKRFGGEPDSDHYIFLPGVQLDDDPENNLENNTLRLKANTVKDIFDPVVGEIIRLIRDQVQQIQLKNERIKAICLVGGFGASQYLLQCVQKENPTIKVAQPNDAWAAIAKGAVLSKMPNNAVVTSFSAVRNYGVMIGRDFDPIIDHGQPTYAHKFDGTAKVIRLDWHIKIGDNIRRSDKIRIGVMRSFPDDYTDDDLIISQYLYDSGDRVAPLHPSESGSLNINCTLVTDFRKVPKDKFIRKYGPPNASQVGKGAVVLASNPGLSDTPYWTVSFDLVISFNSALMIFSTEINGIPFGVVEARFAETA